MALALQNQMIVNKNVSSRNRKGNLKVLMANIYIVFTLCKVLF